MSELLLQMSGVSHSYGDHWSLRGVDLTLEAGEVVGLLGPNGAGKSTLVRSAVGLERPRSGTIQVADHAFPAEAWAGRRQLGYMPQSPALFEDLTALENVIFFGSAFSGEAVALERRARELLHTLDLAAVAERPVAGFSGGMKERVSLACALVHEPKVLLLDEPTAGIDPLISQRIWSHLRNCAAGGAGILVSTHLLEEVWNFDRVVILRAGRVLAQENPRRLLERVRSEVRVKVAGKLERFELANLAQDLPALLGRWGLDGTVSEIDVRLPTVQEALVAIYGETSPDV